MGGIKRRFAREVIARAAAKVSPEAAVARYLEYMDRFVVDLAARRAVYTQHIEAARDRLLPDQYEHLRAVWNGICQYQDAPTDAEREQIDAWLNPLIVAPTVESLPNWMSVLMEPYFEGAVDTELDELARVPGFWEVEREWKDEADDRE